MATNSVTGCFAPVWSRLVAVDLLFGVDCVYTLSIQTFSGMLQNRFLALDRLSPLPAVGLKDFVEGYALHTSRKAVGRVDVVEGYALHTSRKRVKFV